MGARKTNNYIIDEANMIAKIELRRRDGENLWTIIDLDDLDRVINYPHAWYAKYSKTIQNFYAAANVHDPTGERVGTLHLHQFILNTRENHVDHINHNSLDNRKSNLREVSPSQNYRNRSGVNKNSVSGYRNVSWSKRDNKWLVQLQIDGKNVCLRKYDKEDLEEAGRFAARMREKYYGEFAGDKQTKE